MQKNMALLKTGEKMMNNKNIDKILLPQNFGSYKILSGACIFILIVSVLLPLFMGIFDLWSLGGTFFLVMTYLFFGFISVANLFLLINAIVKYSGNFGVSGNIYKNLKIFRLSVLLWFFLYWFISIEEPSENVILLLVCALLILSGISVFLIGVCVYKVKDNDFVGEMEFVGKTLIIASMIPPGWILVPITTYFLFSKAERYSMK